MSQFADRFAVAADRLYDVHGDSVTHWIGGDAGNTETITAIVDLDVQRQVVAGNYVTRSDRHGERTNATVYLLMQPDVEVGDNDKFVLPDGRIVNFVEEVSSDVGNGLKKITCILPNGITTRRVRPRP